MVFSDLINSVIDAIAFLQSLVLFTLVMMPKKDGFSLAKDIRSVNADIPLIFLTAKSMKEDVAIINLATTFSMQLV